MKCVHSVCIKREIGNLSYPYKQLKSTKSEYCYYIEGKEMIGNVKWMNVEVSE